MIKQEILFSIIIPIYNVEKYLEECLQSVIYQTYTNFEVILINDGSTDKSKEICEKIILKDSRFKLINIENKGVSNARNLGIEKSIGEYLLFIDSDDYIENNTLDKINKVIAEYNIDYIIYGINKIINNKNIINKLSKKDEFYKSKKEIKEILPLLINQEIINSPIKVYKSKLIKENNLRFDTYLSIGEDYLFNIEYLDKIENLYYLSDILYKYIIRNENSLTQRFNINKYDELMYLNKKVYEIMSNSYYLSEKVISALSYIKLKNIYSCILDIHKKNYHYNNYENKVCYIKKIINNYENIEFKSGKIKILDHILKTRNILLIYNITNIMYFIKKISTTNIKFNYKKRVGNI